MGSLNMKLRYEISEMIKLSRQSLIDTIALKLKEDKYHILSVTDSKIEFNRYNGVFNPRMGSLSKIDAGVFEVIELNADVVLRLIYFKSYLEEIVIVPTLILCGFFIDRVILVFPLVILIAFIARLVTLKNMAKNLMKEILFRLDEE